MAQQTIDIGTEANDGTGDPLRDAFDKVNDNDTELYGDVASLQLVVTGRDTIDLDAAADSGKLLIWDGGTDVASTRPECNTRITRNSGSFVLTQNMVFKTGRVGIPDRWEVEYGKDSTDWAPLTAFSNGVVVNHEALEDGIGYNWQANGGHTSGATWDATEQANWFQLNAHDDLELRAASLLEVGQEGISFHGNQAGDGGGKAMSPVAMRILDEGGVVLTDDNYLNIGVDSSSPNVKSVRPLTVSNTDATTAPSQIIYAKRESALNVAVTGMLLVHNTTQAPADGLGVLVQFGINGSGASETPIADFGAVRAGSNTTGDLFFRTKNAGSLTEKFRIKADGGIEMPDIPTSDPGVAGELWADATDGYTVKLSQG